MSDKIAEAQLLIIAGFPRTGTTSLYHNLSLHPGFATPARKELNFFCGDEPLSQYRRHFSHAAPGQILVDASPFYSLDPKAPARIKSAFPGARIVLTLRQPSRWLPSLYLQTRSLAAKPRGVDVFLAFPAIDVPFDAGTLAVSDGMFGDAVARFAEAFGDGLLLVNFAVFERAPLEVLQAVERFAGALPFFTEVTADTRAFNSSQLAVRIPGPLRRLLAHKLVVRAVPRLFPAAVIKRVRRTLDFGFGARPVEGVGEFFSATDMEAAAHLMPRDTRLVEILFANSPFLTGTGALERLSGI